MKRISSQAARRSAKQLRAIQTSRHFHFSQHQHTGKVLPHGHTSYPTLLMILLCVGVLLTGWTKVVTADNYVNLYPNNGQDSYSVHASVPGPAPTQAATIDSPVTDVHVATTPITISGSCPSNTYVSVYRNNFYSGSAICDVTGTYQLSVDLFSGANQLVARDYNFTDVAGPDSVPTTVYYDPPTMPSGNSGGSSAASGNTSTSSSASSAAQSSSSNEQASKGFSVNTSSGSSVQAAPAVPLTVSTDFGIRGYYVGQQSVWQLNIAGGLAPYALAVDWGDGSTGVISRGSAGSTQFTHSYQKAGGYEGTYAVKFTATDAAGNQTFLQLLVIVNNRQPATFSRTSQAGGNISGGIGGLIGALANLGHDVHYRLVHYVWPTYGFVVLMVLSFWLGERREYLMLKTRGRRHHHA